MVLQPHEQGMAGGSSRAPKLRGEPRKAEPITAALTILQNIVRRECNPVECSFGCDVEPLQPQTAPIQTSNALRSSEDFIISGAMQACGQYTAFLRLTI